MADIGTGGNITMDLIETIVAKESAWTIAELAERFRIRFADTSVLLGEAKKETAGGHNLLVRIEE